MAEQTKLILAAALILAILIALIVGIILRNRRIHYVGAIHLVVDGYDSERYMFLVIEKGKDIYLQDGKMVKLKIVEDIPERGRDS